MSTIWTPAIYEDVQQYVEDASKYPTEVDNMYHLGCNEGKTPIEKKTFVETLVNAKVMPQKILNEILHEAAEWRDVEYGEFLLKMGADPKAKKFNETDQEFTLLETLLWGHDGYNRNDVEDVLEFARMLKKYDPSPTVGENTLYIMQMDEWQGLNDDEYRKLVGLYEEQ